MAPENLYELLEQDDEEFLQWVTLLNEEVTERKHGVSLWDLLDLHPRELTEKVLDHYISDKNYIHSAELICDYSRRNIS